MFVRGAMDCSLVSGPRVLCRNNLTFNEFRDVLTSCPTGALRRAVPKFRSAEREFRAFGGTIRRSIYDEISLIQRRVRFMLSERRVISYFRSLLEDKGVDFHIARGSAGVGGILVSGSAGGKVYIVSLSAMVPKMTVGSFKSTIQVKTDATLRSRRGLSGI